MRNLNLEDDNTIKSATDEIWAEAAERRKNHIKKAMLKEDAAARAHIKASKELEDALRTSDDDFVQSPRVSATEVMNDCGQFDIVKYRI